MKIQRKTQDGSIQEKSTRNTQWACECVTPNNATVQGTSTGRKGSRRGRRRRRGEGEGGGGVPAPLCLSLTSVPQGKRRPSRPLIFLEAAFPSNLKKVNTRCNRSENSAKTQFVMIPALDEVTMGEVRVVKVPGLGFLDAKAADRLQELFEV